MKSEETPPLAGESQPKSKGAICDLVTPNKHAGLLRVEKDFTPS
jgi:hypothetical protein